MQLVYQLCPLFLRKVVGVDHLPELRLGFGRYLHVTDVVLMGVSYELCYLRAVCGVSLPLGLEYYVEFPGIKKKNLACDLLQLPCEVVGASPSFDCHHICLPKLGEDVLSSFVRHAA